MVMKPTIHIAGWLAAAALGLQPPASQAATAEDLARVQLRLQQAAAPWCERLAERDAEGRKRCTVKAAVAHVPGLVNAMSGLGGTWITAELLPHLSEQDLALVLGHEFAHLTLGHALQRLRAADPTDPARRALLTWVELASVPPHDDAPTDTRQQELDADELGLYFAGLAGYPVEALATFWSERAAQLPASTLRLAATHNAHPDNASRGAALTSAAVRFCAQMAAGQDLMPAAAHLQPRHEMAVDELREQQARLPVSAVCPIRRVSAAR
jgi:predicted Zn-dependent protease